MTARPIINANTGKPLTRAEYEATSMFAALAPHEQRYQVTTDGLTTTPIFSRRYAVVDTHGPKDDAGRFTKAILETDDARHAEDCAYENNCEAVPKFICGLIENRDEVLEVKLMTKDELSTANIDAHRATDGNLIWVKLCTPEMASEASNLLAALKAIATSAYSDTAPTLRGIAQNAIARAEKVRG